MFKEKIIIEMKEVFKEIPFGIEHTLKVLKNAEDIMNGENIGEEEKEFISITAILHDIGAVEAQKKYGSIDGVYQEKEGPAVAKEILKKVGYNKNIDRICFIIGNHHTPSKINGLDFQIQWEADLLENLMVMDKEKEQENLKSATKLFSVLLASKRPLITELADKLRLKYPPLPTISPCPTMRLEAIRSIIPISCRRYPKSV